MKRILLKNVYQKFLILSNQDYILSYILFFVNASFILLIQRLVISKSGIEQYGTFSNEYAIASIAAIAADYTFQQTASNWLNKGIHINELLKIKSVFIALICICFLLTSQISTLLYFISISLSSVWFFLLTKNLKKLAILTLLPKVLFFILIVFFTIDQCVTIHFVSQSILFLLFFIMYFLSSRIKSNHNYTLKCILKEDSSMFFAKNISLTYTTLMIPLWDIIFGSVIQSEISVAYRYTTSIQALIPPVMNVMIKDE